MFDEYFEKKKYESKRNSYEKLYKKLDTLITRHQEVRNHMKQTNQHFLSLMPTIDNQCYPGLDFDSRQKQLHEDVESYVSKEVAHLIHLSSARTEAYNQYLYDQE